MTPDESKSRRIPANPSDDARERAQISKWDLATGFALVGLYGFGGIAAALFHVVVERRKWLTVEEYASTLALGQVLPGANLINLATIVGDRFQGAPGAAVALAGLTGPPLVILVALATLYDRFSYLPDVRAAVAAAAAGAVGLTLGVAAKMARSLLKAPRAWVVAVASFVAIGLLNLPMLWTMLVLAPLAVLAEFLREAA